MPYCPECGNEVSITDKRCSKCGTKITPDLFNDIPTSSDFFSNFTVNKPHDPNAKAYNNIEFILALIAVILAVLSVSNSSIVNNYFITASQLIFVIFIPILIGLIGAFIVRYYAKTGAVILLISLIGLIIVGIYDFLPLIFYILTIILCFVRHWFYFK